MSEKPLFGLRLATGNSRKLEQAQKTLPKDITLSVIKPLFNEDEIKDRLDVPLTRGIEYVGALSREKFLVQRKKEKESAKKEEDDFTLICSDSVVLFEKDGRQIALNRNATDKQKAEAITAINRDKEITFVGATTFGWRDGISALTIATYLKVPLKSEIKALPFEIDNLPNMVTKEGFEIGFIDFEMDRKKGEFKLKFKRKDETKDFDRARPFQETHLKFGLLLNLLLYLKRNILVYYKK